MLLLCVCVCILALAGDVRSQAGANNNGVVVCYVGSWAYWRQGAGKFEVEDVDASLCTHLIYSFALLDASSLTIKPSDPYLDLPTGLNYYGRYTSLKNTYPNLKVLLALGGWTDSRNTLKYSDLVSVEANRQDFINDVIPFLGRYGFDGLDLDWEYPAAAGSGRPTDKANFAIFVAQLKAAFVQRNLLLTAAVSASESIINKAYDIPQLAQHLDFIHLMTYDFHGSWESQADHHSPLYNRSYDTTNFYSEYSVNYWINGGAPASKLVLGIPLYGRTFTLNSTVTAPPAPSSGAGSAGQYTGEAGFLSYYEICTKLAQGWTKVADPTGKMGPYAYSGNQWVGYDDPDMIKKKVTFIKQRGLGGAMVWAIDLDDFSASCNSGSYPVLRTLKTEMLTQTSITTTTTTNQPSTTTTTTTATTTTTPPNQYFVMYQNRQVKVYTPGKPELTKCCPRNKALDLQTMQCVPKASDIGGCN